GGGGQKPGSDIISVKVQVRGLDRAVMYPEQTVKLGPGEQNPLAALRKLVGRDKVETAYGDAYVVAIGDLREKAYGPTSGWCYRVNGEIPQVPAKDYPLKDGAEVEWFYVRSVSEAGSGVGRVPEQEQGKIPTALKPSQDAQEVLEKLAQVLGLASDGVELGPVEGVGRAVAVVGSRTSLSLAERVAAKKELQANNVDLVQKVAADEETTLADAGAELALVIPAGALARDVEVRIREVRQPEKAPPLPPGFRLMSSLYDCGPEGTTFKVPATLSLRLVVPPVVKPENLVLARYDTEGGTWSALPAVVDLARGLVMARVRHFSILAVLVREARASFADVTGDSSWARDAVELLAGAGILKGVDENRFDPAREVTRAEATAMLVRALGLPAATTRAAFRDVREND
ncbi:MAG: S-layer homology domain-containing protein, partial [Firmicutes bacterium]|nr:S-layer homology domain-containing protein [Bacillota bacterium]